MTTRSLLYPEGIETRLDRRIILPGATTWREPVEMPLMQATGEFHSVEMVGKIIGVERDEQSRIWIATDVDIPAGIQPCADLADDDREFEDQGERGILLRFHKVRLLGATLFPVEQWAWAKELIPA